MKFKRLFSGLLVSLIAIVNVLLCVKVSSAAGDTFKKVTDVNDLAVGDVIAIVSENSKVALSTTQNSNNRGQASISISNETFISTDEVEYITLEAGTVDSTFAFKVSKGYLYAASSSSNNLKSQESNDANGSWKVTISSGNAIVKAQGTNSRNWLKYNSSSKIFSCYSSGQTDIQIYKKEVSSSDYNVSFDAKGATFVTGKGETITTAVGTETKVILPTIEDLVYGCKEIMPLAGWSDGTKTYQPGAEVPVSDTTQFTAVYSEDNSKTLSVAEARTVCDLIGGTATTKLFNVTGIVSKINTSVVITDENNDELSLTLYYPATDSVEAGIAVGDKIIGTGNLLLYNSKTYELNTGCTYEKVTAPKPATAVEFEKVETMSSLSFDWATEDGNNYTVTNVSLRFGNLFSSNAYDSNAKYGLLLIQDSALNGGDFASYLKDMTSDEINADENIVCVNATPVKVNAEGVADETGEYYQFAAVLSDMDEELSTSITAIMYMVVDGQVYYSIEKSASVKSTANQYLDEYLDDKLVLSDDEIKVLEVLAK